MFSDWFSCLLGINLFQLISVHLEIISQELKNGFRCVILKTHFTFSYHKNAGGCRDFPTIFWDFSDLKSNKKKQQKTDTVKRKQLRWFLFHFSFVNRQHSSLKCGNKITFIFQNKGLYMLILWKITFQESTSSVDFKAVYSQRACSQASRVLRAEC